MLRERVIVSFNEKYPLLEPDTMERVLDNWSINRKALIFRNIPGLQLPIEEIVVQPGAWFLIKKKEVEEGMSQGEVEEVSRYNWQFFSFLKDLGWVPANEEMYLKER